VRAADLPLLSQIILLLSPNNFERASEARTEAFLRGQVCQPSVSMNTSELVTKIHFFLKENVSDRASGYLFISVAGQSKIIFKIFL